MTGDWKGWKNGKYDRRYRGVKRHSGQKVSKRAIKLSLVIAGVLIFGYLIFQNYVNSETIQKGISAIFGGEVTLSSTKNNPLTATPNKILTEDNYYAQLVPTNIKITDKGRYNLVNLSVRIDVQDMPFDANVSFRDLYTTLKDEKSKVYEPDKTECALTELIPINGKSTNTATYSVCYSVDKTAEKLTIFYSEPQFNYHATKIGYLIMDGDFFKYYETHRNPNPVQIGIIDLTK